jgi:hypothetical protein
LKVFDWLIKLSCGIFCFSRFVRGSALWFTLK